VGNTDQCAFIRCTYFQKEMMLVQCSRKVKGKGKGKGKGKVVPVL